jgi:predicted HTH transcriptional regulator
MDIIKLLQKGEGKTLEFKREVSAANLLKTVISFANTSGGVILMGVGDNGTICGVKDTLKVEEQISSLIYDSIEPRIIPDIEMISWRNKQVLAIEISHGNQWPFFLRSKGVEKGTFIRIGSTNRLAGPEIIAELKRHASNKCFDEEPFLEKSSEGLDLQTISEYIERTGKHFSRSQLKTLRLNVGFNNTTVPTNGAYILFGKDRLNFFPDARIQAALFAGTDKSEMIDSVDLQAPLIEAIEQAMIFIKRNIAKKSEIKDIYRADIYSYPIAAIREVLINSVVHTDYSLRGSPISVAIFNDRIEVTNPGGLPFGLTMEDIYLGVSKLRNHVIGRFFREMHLIEQWGSGIGRVINECKAMGLKTPRFEEIGVQFRATLYRSLGTRLEIADAEKKIIDALKKNREMSTGEIARTIQKTERTARTKMLGLVKKGLVVEIGLSPQDPHKKYRLAG